MEKKEKHYSLLKGALIFIIIAFILTWIIPAGGYGSSGYTQTGMARLGIYDIAYNIYYAVSFGVDKIILLLAIGALYGLLSRTQGYERIVSGIAGKIKHKKIAVVAFSVVIAALTSLLTQTFVVLIFIPFIISILNRMKLDKMTILATTFGSMLVGIMGATYGTDGLYWFNYYLGYTLEFPFNAPALLVRAGILVIGLILFNFFTITHMNKVDEKAPSVDLFAVTVSEDNVKKTKSMIPIIIIGILILAISILGFMDWDGNFGVNTFNDFHEFLTEDIKIEASDTTNDFYVFQDLLGSGMKAFGSWDNVTITAVLVIFIGILALCYRFKLKDLFESIISGIKKMILPIACIAGAYLLMIVVYQSTYVATIVNRILTLTDTFNIATMTLSSLILNIFHTDLGFTGWVMGAYLPVEYVDYINPVYVMFTSLYGFVQFFIPTSMILGIGLVLLKIKYGEWLKYIWRFLLGMFICLLIIFILMAII